MPPALRIVMLGTKDFALPTFLALCESPHQVLALVTQPDRPQGRKQELIPSAIKLSAMERGIPVEQPEDVNAPDAVAMIRGLEPDLLVTAAYGQILSAELLGSARLGGVNLHGSILPAYRGAAPVARAIQRGETETGVTVILMTPRIDAGGMIKVASTPIGPDETAGELESRLATLGAPLVAEVVTELAAGTVRALSQDRARVTKAPKLSKDDSPIDWSQTAQRIHDHVRAMQPWPVAQSILRRAASSPGSEPIRVLIHRTEVDSRNSDAAPGQILEANPHRLLVAAKGGSVRLVTVQVPGKKALPAADFLRGLPLAPGDVFRST